MANNRISVLVAIEGADDGLKRALNSAQQSLGELATTAKTAGDKAARGMAEVKAGMSAFGDQVATAKTQLLAFLSINWAAGKVHEIVQIADAWNMMGARLKLATVGQNEFVTAQKALFDIAQRIGVPIQEVSTLYGKLLQAVRLEFARRGIEPEGTKKETPADLLPHMRHYADRKQEHFLCASINGANEILNIRVVSIGLIDRSPVHPRDRA